MLGMPTWACSGGEGVQEGEREVVLISCFERGGEWGGWRRNLPLRLAFRAREGVVGKEMTPSVLRFKQGRE